ncbi:alpha/beta fold hydrolase [Microvirga pudoricolor]|uniref:alpha/beta fold hydrolase n=1 Tax=Microvirga pudoricolor TaxID=2778729 RepID=UPI00194E52FD|nr:alpha/beta hydrolase [Microvirga pudoricolor]MBM6594929.1 alpha/beta hydrolase [Microvirga pudoricolor]
MTILRYGALGLALLVAACALFTQIYAWWIERTYPPTGRFVTVPGGRLHYRETGPTQGQVLGTIVLLHGASSNLEEAMLGLGTHLVGRYRVIAFDRPGHGWSDRIGGDGAARPDRQAAVLADGMRQLGVKDAVVVGHSFSGSIIPNLALDHRDVTGAILELSGVTYPWPDGAIDWHYTAATSWLGWVFTRTVTTPVGLLLLKPGASSSFAPQPLPPGFLEASRIRLIFRPSVFQANAEDVAELNRAVIEQSPRYKDIRVPATVMGGEADRIVWTDLHVRSFAAAVPGAKLVTLPGVGHMPQYTQPERVIREIEALAEQVARAGKKAAAQ